MIKIIKLLGSEITNTYHTYLFVPSNRKKLLKLLIGLIIGFGCWLSGYKWRDAKIIVQTIQIEHLTEKRAELKANIDQLETSLEDYNFMLEDGDYYRYLAYKHGEVLIPNTVNAEDLKLITDQAKKYEIPFKYIYRLIWKESKYNPTAQSHKGAKGYMQVMPATFAAMKDMYHKKNENIDNLSGPQQNIMVGTFTLNYLYNKYKNWKLAFAAYNAGSGAVDKANGIPQFAETQAYVKYIVNKQ